MSICYRCQKIVDPSESQSGLHIDCFCIWFEASKSGDFCDLVARSSEQQNSSSEWDRVNTIFFHGKFRKYSARLGKHSYPLKVVQTDYPELPATEYLCNQLAQEIGLNVPDFYMILLQEKLECFVSKNFMGSRPNSNLVHIYRYCKEPSDYNCEYLLHIIEKEVGRYDAIKQFIELCIFDSLTGNHDRHGRNLGIIRTANETLLAPFYDNPCYLALEIPELLSAHHEPRGAIATASTREPVMKDYVAEWRRLGFLEEVAKFTELIDLKKNQSLISLSFISETRKAAIIKLIQRRYQELCDAI